MVNLTSLIVWRLCDIEHRLHFVCCVSALSVLVKQCPHCVTLMDGATLHGYIDRTGGYFHLGMSRLSHGVKALADGIYFIFGMESDCHYFPHLVARFIFTALGKPLPKDQASGKMGFSIIGLSNGV